MWWWSCWGKDQDPVPFIPSGLREMKRGVFASGGLTSLIKRLVSFGVQCLILGFCSSFLLSGSLGVSTLAQEDKGAERGVQVARLRQWEQMQTSVPHPQDELPWTGLSGVWSVFPGGTWLRTVQGKQCFMCHLHVLALNSSVLLGNNMTHWNLFSRSFLSAVRNKGCLLLDTFMAAPELEMWSKCMFLLEADSLPACKLAFPNPENEIRDICTVCEAICWL